MNSISKIIATSVAVVFSAWLIGCGADSPSSYEPKNPQSPSPYVDDFDARMASDGENLWLAVLGENKDGDLRLAVYKRESDRWQPLPGRPVATSSADLLIAADPASKGSQLYVGFGVADGEGGSVPRIKRFDGHQWTNVPLPGRLAQAYLAGMETLGGEVIALFTNSDEDRTIVQLAHLDGDEVTPYGPARNLSADTISTLGQEAGASSGNVVDVAVENLGDGTRWTMTLDGGKWQDTARVPATIPGPQVSGTVRDSDRIFFPVNEAVREGELAFNWPFSVFRLTDSGDKGDSEDSPWSRVNDAPLNVGKGTAQGSVDAAGDEVWASWVQNVWNDYKAMPTRYFASKIGPDGQAEEPIQLWKGVTGGASQTQVEAYDGGFAFLFMRQKSPTAGAKATVSFAETDD